MVNREKITKEFERIRTLGYIKSNRSHNTGIGKTFEDHLGVVENNLIEPDFAGFEVKSKRAKTSSYLTLFTKSPSHPKQINTILCNTYGEDYVEYPGLKRLHTSVFSGKCNTYRNLYGFQIINDKQGEKVVLEIQDLETNKVIDAKAHWTYHCLKKCVEKKLGALFFVSADTKLIEGIEHFHYTSAEIHMNPSFENLLKLIDEGKLMVDLRIGSYKSGSKKGKAHDHGTGFRIKPSDLHLLYAESFTIE